MDEPLATYEEARFESRRQFELYPDRIRVVGQVQGIGRFDQFIVLSSLQPTVGRMWVRSRLFSWGLCGLFIAACGMVSLVLSGGYTHLLNPSDGVPLLVMGSTCATAAALVSGVFLTLLHARRVEFATFRTDAGVIGLDVARAGPRVAEYDEFVDLLADLIASCRGEATRSPSSRG